MSGKMKALRHRTAGGNRFYIDSGSVLWGYGSNDYGQLGNGQRDELGVFYSEPIRIASDVVSVDMSMNGYFCIYLTSDGKLYGMGADIDHILGEDAADAGLIREMEYNEIICLERQADWEAAKEKITAYTEKYPDDENARKEAEFLQTR